jgi:hypothetical protein
MANLRATTAPRLGIGARLERMAFGSFQPSVENGFARGLCGRLGRTVLNDPADLCWRNDRGKWAKIADSNDKLAKTERCRDVDTVQENTDLCSLRRGLGRLGMHHDVARKAYGRAD